MWRIFVMLTALALPAQAHLDGSVCGLPAGMPVPAVSVQTLDGKAAPVVDSGVQVVVFWSIYDAEALAPMMKAAQAARSKASVLAVNLDSKALNRNLPAKIRARADQLAVRIPMAADPLRYSRDAFHLKKTPALVLLKDGRIDSAYAFSHAEDAPLFEANLRKCLGK